MYQQRFSGIARLYGKEALTHFQHAHIGIIGIGGVGSWCVEALARSGIGTMTLIDMDDICISNTNRQLHTLNTHIGQLKTDVMAKRAQQINPSCQINIIDDFLTVDNVSTLITPQFDYIIDAIDSIPAKAALLSYCLRQLLPAITVGSAGGQIDPTQINIADLGCTTQDPLLARLRQQLKRDFSIHRNNKGKYGIDAVFSTEPLRYPQPNGSVCASKKQRNGNKRMDCASGFGAVTTVTATFGFVAVSQVLRKLA